MLARFIAILALICSSYGCRSIRVNEAATKDFGSTGYLTKPTGAAVYCHAVSRVKCEYGSKGIYQTASSEAYGYAAGDFCKRIDGKLAWTLLNAEPFLEHKLCRDGMTRVELGCQCQPVAQWEAQKAQDNIAVQNSRLPVCKDVGAGYYQFSGPKVSESRVKAKCKEINRYGDATCYEYYTGDVLYATPVPCGDGQAAPPPQFIPQ